MELRAQCKKGPNPGGYLRTRNPDSAGVNRKHKIKGGDSIMAMKKSAISDLGEM
jgi:hypothetical protein